jgi:hypothetical protein
LVLISGISYPSATTTGSSPNLLETSNSGPRPAGRPGTSAGVDPDSGHDEDESAEICLEKEKKITDEEIRNNVVGPRGINRINCKTLKNNFSTILIQNFQISYKVISTIRIVTIQ